MESFRTIIRGWLGKVLLVLFLTPLALVGIEGYFSGNNKADVATTVNGQDISKKDLDNLTKNYKDQYLSAVNGDETLLNQSFIEKTALDTLIARNLLLQQAEKLGISLSDAQIEQMLAQQPSFQENGKFSQSLYENYLRSVGMTSQALISSLRQDHALKMLTSSVLGTALVSKADINQVATLQTEQRTLHLASIKLDDYKKTINVSNQEIANYYNQHKNNFKQIANVDVDYVVLSPSQVTTNAQVTDADLQNAYKAFVEAQNKNAQRTVKHILITTDARSDADAQKLANEIYAKISAGQLSFANAAKQYSDDTSSKNAGGVLDAYEPGVFSSQFDQAVNTLKNGQISKPVKTQYGYHIIETTVQAPNIPSFDAEKARLTAEVQKAKAANAYSDAVNRLNETVVSSDDLSVITQEFKTAKIESVNGVSLATTQPVLSEANVKARIFSDAVANGDRNISSNLQLKNGDTAWVKVRNYHAAGVQTLAQATPAVKNQLIEQKAYDAARAKLAKTLDAFKTQPAAQAIAASGLTFENAGTFARSHGLNRSVERTAFSLAAPKEGMWSVGTAKLPDELVVIGVSNVNSAAASTLTPDQLKELTQLYQQFRGQQELDDYTQYLKSKAKIK